MSRLERAEWWLDRVVAGKYGPHDNWGKASARTLKKEIAALRHDLDLYIQIASDLATEAFPKEPA